MDDLADKDSRLESLIVNQVGVLDNICFVVGKGLSEVQGFYLRGVDNAEIVVADEVSSDIENVLCGRIDKQVKLVLLYLDELHVTQLIVQFGRKVSVDHGRIYDRSPDDFIRDADLCVYHEPETLACGASSASTNQVRLQIGTQLVIRIFKLRQRAVFLILRIL